MKYNSQEEHLRMPEYGRMVQKMAEHALAIEDRGMRLRYCEEIVRIMELMTQKQKKRKGLDLTQKYWDHLAFITDYELDIDYPVEIQRQDTKLKPNRVGYPQQKIRYRHYGHLLESALKKISSMPEGKERDRVTQLAAARMKQSLALWKKDNATDAKVAHDMEEYMMQD